MWQIIETSGESNPQGPVGMGDFTLDLESQSSEKSIIKVGINEQESGTPSLMTHINDK